MVELFYPPVRNPLCARPRQACPRRSRRVTIFSTEMSWTYDVNQSFSAARTPRFTDENLFAVAR